MSTTRSIKSHVQTIQGMDSTTPPHLVDESKWTMCRGMRSYYGKLIQFPNFVFRGVLNVSNPTVDGIFTLPTGIRAENLTITFASSSVPGVYQLRDPINTSIRLARIDGTLASIRTDAGDNQLYNRIVGTIYNNTLYFTDPTTKLRYTDGTNVVEYTNLISGNIRVDFIPVIPSSYPVIASTVIASTSVSFTPINLLSVIETFSITSQLYTIIYTTSEDITFGVGDTVRVTNSPYGTANTPFVVTAVGNKTFTHTRLTPIIGFEISQVVSTSGQVTLVTSLGIPTWTVKHAISGVSPFNIGDNVTISGSSQGGLNTNFIISLIQGNTFGYITTIQPSGITGTSSFGNTGAIVKLTNAPTQTSTGPNGKFTSLLNLPPNFVAGQNVRFSGFATLSLNGIVKIISILDSFSFTFQTISSLIGTDSNTGTVQPEFGNINVPSSRYITNFFDHIVVLNSTFKGVYEPWTCRWSDLYNPGQWEPNPENEADSFDLVGWQRSSGIMAGGTGMGRLGDVLYLYTESCIFKMVYTGLPKVMQVSVAFEDYGNFFLNGLVTSRDVHLFFDAYYQNFFLFDGFNRPKPIGDDILGFFLANVNFSFTSIDVTQQLTSFAVADKNEAWWCFYATTLASYVAIVYNWSSDSWTILKLSGRIKLIGGGGTRALTCDELTGTCDNLTGVCDDLSKTDIVIPRTYIFEPGSFHRELASGEVATSSLVEFPFMETRDLITDLQREVEVDRICIHATHSETSTTAGINVYVSARQNLQDTVVYKFVGKWTRFTPQGILSFPAQTGRVFRYKFQLTGSATEIALGKPHEFVFYDFTDNVFNMEAEK
jgi:hypothetical protein